MDDLSPVLQDGELLLRKFVERNSTQFSDFSDVWKEINFSLIFWVGNDRSQKAEVAGELLGLGVQWMTGSDRDLCSKLAGLFLAYTVFFVQPCQPKALVRATISHFDKLNQLHEQLREEKLWDGHYTMCMLRARSAFSLCCCERPLCLGRGRALTKQSESVCQEEHAATRALQAVDCHLREHHQLKQQIGECLPQHLLNPSPLSVQTQRVVEECWQCLSEGPQ